MRISPITSNRPVSDEKTLDESQVESSGRRVDGVPAEAKAPSQRPLRGELRQWDTQVNRQLASAQQALAFLEQVESRLEGLKADIGAKLGASQAGDAKLDGKVRDFAGLWQQRQAVSGGSLDGQLGFSLEAPARQNFSIRGLGRNALHSGEKETLAFSVGGIGQRLMVVAVEPGLPEAVLVRRFDKALAPADIRAAGDGQGGVRFSVSESAWPKLRDTLAVKGAGIRFPSGQLTRVKIDVEPDVIRPEAWRSGDIEGLRRTLHEIVEALGRVRRVREELNNVLVDARIRLNEGASIDERARVFSFATDFEALAAQPSYQIYSAIAPALASISRERVLSLLAL